MKIKHPTRASAAAREQRQATYSGRDLERLVNGFEDKSGLMTAAARCEQFGEPTPGDRIVLPRGRQRKLPQPEATDGR